MKKFERFSTVCINERRSKIITELYDVDKGIVNIPHFGLDHIFFLDDDSDLVTWAFPIS